MNIQSVLLGRGAGGRGGEGGARGEGGSGREGGCGKLTHISKIFDLM